MLRKFPGVDYCTQFFYAIRTANTRAACHLLDENPELANMRENRSVTGLHLVSQLGNVELAELLIGRGADMEAISQTTGSTPLKYAVFFCQIEMVKLLLKRGADIENRGNTTRTPLELALSATEPMFRQMGTPGSDLDYARIANILRSRSARQ